MKPGQTISVPIGTGTALLTERNNGLYPPNLKTPKLVLMNPAYSWIEDGVHCQTPAVSLEVYNPEALYKLLHEYYTT